MSQIKYTSGYKYRLEQDHIEQLDIHPLHTIYTEFAALEPDGQLTVYRGYAWDGPSGPAIDTQDFMRGSLVHDVLYQLIREGWLKDSVYFRKLADQILYQITREDGMSWIRANWVWLGVRYGGGPHVDPAHAKKIQSAGDPDK